MVYNHTVASPRTTIHHVVRAMPQPAWSTVMDLTLACMHNWEKLFNMQSVYSVIKDDFERVAHVNKLATILLKDCSIVSVNILVIVQANDPHLCTCDICRWF